MWILTSKQWIGFYFWSKKTSIKFIKYCLNSDGLLKKKKKKNIYYKKSKLNVHPTVLLRYLLHKGYSINIKSQTKEIFTNERTNENNLPFPTPHKKGTEQNERKLLDSQVSFDLKLLRSFFSNVRTTLYNIITSITGKYCSVAFFGIVTPKKFLHRLKS